MLIQPYTAIPNFKNVLSKGEAQMFLDIMAFAGISSNSNKNRKLVAVYDKLGIDKKSKTSASMVPFKGKGIIPSADDAINRLQVLIGSQMAGNDSKALKNEIMNLIDFLMHKKLITKTQHKKMYNQYIN